MRNPSTENANRQHKTPAAFLRCAKAILRKGWTQGWFATAADGSRVDAADPKAVKFCMLGAMQKCAQGQKSMEVYFEARNALILSVPHRDVPNFNDAGCRTLEEVLERFDKAIMAAGK